MIFPVVTQIRERADWLAEMEWLGHAGPHREIVEVRRGLDLTFYYCILLD